MKNLYIIRHATAEPHGSKEDFARKLDYPSLKEIATISSTIVKKGWHSDLMLCSSAIRTIETSEKLSYAFKFNKDYIKLSPLLYNAPFEAYLKVIKLQENAINKLAIVGHNPGISHLATVLSNKGQNFNLPTCGLVHLQFKIDHWQELSLGSGQVLDFIIP